MPIYEFKCSKCEEFIEMLVMKNDETMELKCTKCGSYELERVLSAPNYAIGGGGSAAKQDNSSQTRKCSSGSCTTYNIPGIN